MTDSRGHIPDGGYDRVGVLPRLSLSFVRLDPGLPIGGLLALFVILPLLRPGLPGTADTPIHFYRALEFARSWAPGVIYPRWAPDLAFGYGYPLWEFAPPLPYLVPLVLSAAGLSLEVSLKGLVILTAFSYALGAYLFVRDSLGPMAGLVGAAIYTLAPFALREALLYGGNYPQFLAIGLFPWVLWSIWRIYAQRGTWFNVLLTVFFYSGVILSHLFHALILTVVAAAYASVLWLADRRATRQLAASASALGLGLLLTAFFWLPALIERRFTRAVEDVIVSVSPYYLRFLDWSELLAWPRALDARAANPWVPFSLGPAALVLAGLGALVLATNQRVRESKHHQLSQSAKQQDNQLNDRSSYQGIFFLGLLALCIFMVLPVSNWVWANVPFLAVAEFPWRWLGLANLSLAFLGGASVHWLSFPRQAAWAVLVTLVVLLSSAVYLYPFRPFVRYGETLADMVSYELVSQTIGTTTLGEYLPRWVELMPTSSPLVEALKSGQIHKLDRSSLPRGASAQILNRTSVSEEYRFDSSEPFQARFFIHYFPGWTALLDGQPVEVDIEPESGLIRVALPAGTHRLNLRFVDTPLRTASNGITGLTLVALIIAGLGRAAYRARGPVSKADHPPAPVSHHRSSQAGSVWLLRPALFVGSGLMILLLAKGLVVDPHTDWFRRKSPPDRVSGTENSLRVNLDDRFWLLGYDLNRVSVPQGGTLRVVLYWQAQRPSNSNYRSFVHLDAPGDQRTWAGSDNFQPGDVTAQIELPTSTWDVDHYVRDEHLVHIPLHVPPVGFQLRAGLYEPETGRRLPIGSKAGEELGDTIMLQAVRVTRGREWRRADVPNPLAYRINDHIQLLGFDWKQVGSTLTLFWQTSGQSSAEHRQDDVRHVVFVHLLDGQGRLVWGADGPLLGGLYPASAWEPGVIVVDPRQLTLANLKPGRYSLAVGMYDPDTLVRLPVTDAYGQRIAGDAITLTQLTLP